MVEASGSPAILVPQGHYTSIQVLAAGAFGPESNVWSADYVDGTTDTFTVGISGWLSGYDGAGTTAPWESIAAHMTSYNTTSGNHGGNVYLYGYSFSTTASSTVASITLPSDSKVTILAIDEVNQSQQYMVVLKGAKGPDAGVQGPSRAGTRSSRSKRPRQPKPPRRRRTTSSPRPLKVWLPPRGCSATRTASATGPTRRRTDRVTPTLPTAEPRGHPQPSC